jgi:hypothetical protein
MIKKLIVAAILIATFGAGSVTYAQATSGSPGHRIKTRMTTGKHDLSRT